MAITPDAKNWTWVLTKPCPECGFDASTFPAHDVASALRQNAASWRPLLEDPRARRRPSDSVWSALEYGCHVRDVLRVFNGRLRRMLTEDDPLFDNWDQDQTAIDDGYAEQDPLSVLPVLESNGAILVGTLAGVPDSAWSRPGRRSDGSVFTVDTLSRYLLHDPVHHLWDVRQGFTALVARR